MDLLSQALKDYGVAEVTGAGNAPDIMKMAEELGAAYPGDETAWCGLAMAAWCRRAGGAPPPGYLAARNWLSWGQAVEKPGIGDVVVLWRTSPSAWEGHVALFIAQRGPMLYLLGGNQGNAVGIATYPAVRLLGARRP